jgi:hypothetical protein
VCASSCYYSTSHFSTLQSPAVITVRRRSPSCNVLLSQYVTFLHAAVSSYHSTLHFSTLQCPAVITVRQFSLQCPSFFFLQYLMVKTFILLLSHYVTLQCPFITLRHISPRCTVPLLSQYVTFFSRCNVLLSQYVTFLHA